ncbi:F-box protein CPR30-like [Chenopodium quinoa]|uniref:F-box protein CPR30-like n=1 Tax=Chenopodium quinoa TaxID=63459 RepID=UPI000B79A9EB|nr:F-box protein CPR30-like [Chenopodium quinoa]
MLNPRTVEDVIQDFKGRRAGMIKALTKDVDEFYRLCDPNNPNLCLYAFPNQQWEVNLPPPSSELPEPRLGINFVRDSMTKHEWLSMVALHSDAWLYSIASYFATKFKFDKADRKRLFNKITEVSSICELVVDGKKARKRPKTEADGLPEDILVEEVLAKLPVRDLLKYRSVSKLWRSLIDAPDFVYTHLQNYKNNSEVCHLLVLYRPARSWLRDERILVRRGDTFRKVMELQCLYDHFEGAYEMISYINGVFLVKKGKSRGFREIILWNPSINSTLSLPNSMFEAMKEATYFVLGFGYDASRNDYKVIAIIYPHAEIKYYFGERYRATFPGLVQVYTLGTNSWSSNLGVSPPPYWSAGQQIFLNGAIHWINFGPNVTNDADSWFKDKDSYIVSFDVENEVFKYFELPKALKTDEQPKEKFPTVLGRSLAVFCAHYQLRNDIWVMGEYGVSKSWSKCYTFTLQFDKLMHFKTNGELLFAVDGKGIKSYDVRRERVRDLAKTYSRSSSYIVFSYVESLVLFKQVNKRPLESTKP